MIRKNSSCSTLSELSINQDETTPRCTVPTLNYNSITVAKKKIID